MCIEVYTRFRKCAHTRFHHWDYCSILIPRDRLPSTGRLCRRYKLKYVDAKKSEDCVECASERLLAEHTPTNSPTSPTFPTLGAYAPSTTSAGSVRALASPTSASLHSPQFTKNPLAWLNALATDPVPMGVGYEVSATSGHVRASTWGAMSNISNSGESEVVRALKPTIPLSAPFQPCVYGLGSYQHIASEEVETERMIMAESLRTLPPSSFPSANVYAKPQVEMRGVDGSANVFAKLQPHTCSTFPAPARGDERPSGWKAPESWGVSGSEEVKEGEKGEQVKEEKKKWCRGMFKYREGYAGGAF